MVKKSYKIEGMYCASCASLIELDLEDAGVRASCSYAKQMLAVEYDPGTVKEEKIKTVVANAGYRVISS